MEWSSTVAKFNGGLISATKKVVEWGKSVLVRLNQLRHTVIFWVLLRWTLFVSSRHVLASHAVFDVKNLVETYLLDQDCRPVLGPLELLAGLILLSLNPRQNERKYDDEEPVGKPRWMVSSSRLVQLFLFAISPYGSMLHLYAPAALRSSLKASHERLSSWLPSWTDLIKNNFGCRCRWWVTAQLNCPNCSYWSRKTLKQLTGIEDQDIVHMSLQNDIYQIPFYVVLDHSNRAVLILLRGSASAFDVMLDATGFPYPVAEGSPWTGHKGMVQAAQNVRLQLEESGALRKAFQLQPDYNLIVTGHSLGSGVAPILSLLLKDEHPAIKCYAFNPPGATLCPEAAAFCRSFCLSVVNGDDAVSRMSVESVLDLINRVKEAVKASPYSKLGILGRWILRFVFGSNVELIPPILEAKKVRPELLMAGHVLHLEDDDGSGKNYKARFKRPESFNRIIVTPNAIKDHHPDRTLDAMAFL